MLFGACTTTVARIAYHNKRRHTIEMNAISSSINMRLGFILISTKSIHHRRIVTQIQISRYVENRSMTFVDATGVINHFDNIILFMIVVIMFGHAAGGGRGVRVRGARVVRGVRGAAGGRAGGAPANTSRAGRWAGTAGAGTAPSDCSPEKYMDICICKQIKMASILALISP